MYLVRNIFHSDLQPSFNIYESFDRAEKAVAIIKGRIRRSVSHITEDQLNQYVTISEIREGETFNGGYPSTSDNIYIPYEGKFVTLYEIMEAFLRLVIINQQADDDNNINLWIVNLVRRVCEKRGVSFTDVAARAKEQRSRALIYQEIWNGSALF